MITIVVLLLWLLVISDVYVLHYPSSYQLLVQTSCLLSQNRVILHCIVWLPSCSLCVLLLSDFKMMSGTLCAQGLLILF